MTSFHPKQWLLSGGILLTLNFPANAQPSAPPRPAENGYDLYLKAARAFTSVKPAVDPINDTELLTDPKQRAERYSLARRQAWLKANAAGFALFDKAQKSTFYSRSDQTSGLSLLRQLARNKVTEANTFAMQGDWWRTTDSTLDTIQMGTDIMKGNNWLYHLVGTAIVAIGRTGVENPPYVPERLNAVQARSAAKRLVAILARRTTFTESLERDKVLSLVEFDKLTQTPNWRQMWDERKGWQGKLKTKSVSEVDIYNNIIARQNIAIENSKRPWGMPLLPDLPEDADPISANLSFRSDVRFDEGREVTGLNLLLLRYALRAYQAEQGTFPKQLSDLAPRFLKTIPTDYFAAGQPLHYELRGKSYLLWSVGPDGVDNGGIPVPYRSSVTDKTRPAQVNEDSLGDWVAAKNR